MSNNELLKIKAQILKCLTQDFRGNQPLFDPQKGHAIWTQTDLTMVMDAVVKGLKFAQEELNETK